MHKGNVLKQDPGAAHHCQHQLTTYPTHQVHKPEHRKPLYKHAAFARHLGFIGFLSHRVGHPLKVAATNCTPRAGYIRFHFFQTFGVHMMRTIARRSMFALFQTNIAAVCHFMDPGRGLYTTHLAPVLDHQVENN